MGGREGGGDCMGPGGPFLGFGFFFPFEKQKHLESFEQRSDMIKPTF